jgi:hypothetical protein
LLPSKLFTLILYLGLLIHLDLNINVVRRDISLIYLELTIKDHSFRVEARDVLPRVCKLRRMQMRRLINSGSPTIRLRLLSIRYKRNSKRLSVRYML